MGVRGTGRGKGGMGQGDRTGGGGGVWDHIVGRFCNALWDRYPAPPPPLWTDKVKT